ncbi:MAG: zinc ribbon domain-containing protein [Dehalococcoidia bacterium]
MPIYEFRCNACQEKLSLFVRSVTDPPCPECCHCGSRELVRVISSFAYHKSEQTRLEEAGPPQTYPGPDYYQDPHNIGRWAEKRLKDMGMDMRSEEYWNTFSEAREMIDAAREGELPEPLKDL